MKNHYPDILSLRSEVLERLRRLDGVASATPLGEDLGLIAVKPAGGDGDTCNIYVGNLFDRLRDVEAEAIDASIDEFVTLVSTTFVPQRPVATAIYANLRPRSWFENSQVESGVFFDDEFLGDAIVLYQHRVNGMLGSIEYTELAELGGGDSVRASAIDNTRHLLDDLGVEDYNDVASIYFLTNHPSLVTGLLLTGEFRKIVEAKYPAGVLIAVPRRDDIIVFNKAKEGALSRARDYVDGVFDKEEPDLVSRHVFEWRDGKLAVVD